MAGKSFAEFKRGWPVVTAAMLGIGLGLSPMPFYTLGVFAPHLAGEFGWSIGDIMAGLSITTLMVLWAGPLVGWLAVRYGARLIAIVSTILFALSFMAFALSNGSLTLFYVNWALLAVLGAGTLPITWTRPVNSWFDDRRGLALGLSLMGTGIFGFFSKGITTSLIETFGWRGAYVGLGLLPLLIVVPVALFMFRDRDTTGPDAADAKPATGLTTRQALGDWRFWLLAAALLVISFAIAGPIPNMENILKTANIPAATILTLTPFIGLSALAGRLAGGWLLDRFWAPAAGFLILILPGISCWLLASGGITYETALVSILLIGFAVGVEYDLMAYLISRYFGMRDYSVIYGMLYVFFSLGAGFGPLMFGRSFDANGSYDGILILSAVLLVASAASLLLLGPYRQFEADKA